MPYFLEKKLSKLVFSVTGTQPWLRFCVTNRNREPTLITFFVLPSVTALPPWLSFRGTERNREPTFLGLHWRLVFIRFTIKKLIFSLNDISYIFIWDLRTFSAWFNQNNLWNMFHMVILKVNTMWPLSKKSVIQIYVNIWSNLTIVINNRIRAKILFPSFLITLNCYSSKNFPFGRVHPPYIKNWSSEKDRKLKSNKI